MNSHRHSPFPNTHWSLVRRAGVADRDARRAALSVLLERYHPALLSYLLVVKRVPPPVVEDVLQAFLADKLLHHNFLQHADQRRGKFRTFVLTSLNHYVASWQRASKTRETLSLDRQPERMSPSSPTPIAIVEANWARALVLNVLQVMREECIAEKRADVWAVFEGRLIREMFDHREPVPYEELAAELHLNSPTQAANLLVTAKRMYQRLLRQAVGEYEAAESDITQEIADLQNILQRGDQND